MRFSYFLTLVLIVLGCETVLAADDLVYNSVDYMFIAAEKGDIDFLKELMINHPASIRDNVSGKAFAVTPALILWKVISKETASADLMKRDYYYSLDFKQWVMNRFKDVGFDFSLQVKEGKTLAQLLADEIQMLERQPNHRYVDKEKMISSLQTLQQQL